MGTRVNVSVLAKKNEEIGALLNLPKSFVSSLTQVKYYLLWLQNNNVLPPTGDNTILPYYI